MTGSSSPGSLLKSHSLSCSSERSVKGCITLSETTVYMPLIWFPWYTFFPSAGIGSWDVSNVKGMRWMFEDGTAFNQDLSGWCVEQIAALPEGFAPNCPLEVEFYPFWGTCPSDITGVCPRTECFGLYPNPSSKFLSLQFEHPGTYQIRIYSTTGQLILSQEISGIEYQADLSWTGEGIYFITASSEDFPATRKMIKR